MPWFPALIPGLAAMRRRRRLLGALLGALLAVAACVGPAGLHFVITLEQMQEKLAQRFPRRFPLGGLIELNLQTPRLTLRPELNRINVVLALEASGPALRRVYNGVVDVDFALRYEPADQTLRATELQVRALQIDGLPPQAATLMASLGPQLAQQALREVVLYQFKPGDAAVADNLGLQPGRMTVTAQGVSIELASRARP